MFYIEKHIFSKQREVFFLRILPTILVFVAFVSVSIISWSTAKSNVETEQIKILEQRNIETASYVKQRIDTYEDILRGGVGLFKTNEEITREQWQQFLATYAIAERYPGIQGVGYAAVMPKDSLNAHIEKIRNQGNSTYTIRPSGDRDMYTSILYLEPTTSTNQGIIGFDMYTERNRRVAMDTARDQGAPVLSDIVDLIQTNQSPEKHPGFLMYIPVYRTKEIPASIQERRQQLQGFVYAPFRNYELIKQTLKDIEDNYDFELVNSTHGQNQTIYTSPDYENLKNTSGSKAQTTEVALPGSTWQLRGIASPDIVASNLRTRPTATIWSGLLFSFLIAALIYTLLANRSRAIVEKEEQSIQDAKDELLALASHQLRTPATGVKQYIGMLKDGFAGEVTPTQKKLLEKAYQSNERQLGTINEMLFVARADAGQLKMDKTRINLSTLIRDIIDEQRLIITQRNQKLMIKIPRKAIYISGDPQYIRMAYENIISNATKYTKDGGRIHISLQTAGGKSIFTVTDNGVGVAKQDLPLLFKKFSRIPNDLTNQVSGSGIGLYLAKQVIDSHKGQIDFTSEPQKGSTVRITMPLAVQKSHKK